MNTALIRKRIRNAKMKAEEKQVGRYSATTTALLYLDGVVYLPICEEMRKRLDAFEVDGIEDGGMIEYLTRKKKEGRFPVYQTTERPGQGSSGNSGRTRGTADGQFAGSPDLSGNVKQPVSDGGRLLP